MSLPLQSLAGHKTNFMSSERALPLSSGTIEYDPSLFLQQHDLMQHRVPINLSLPAQPRTLRLLSTACAAATAVTTPTTWKCLAEKKTTLSLRNKRRPKRLSSVDLNKNRRVPLPRLLAIRAATAELHSQPSTVYFCSQHTLPLCLTVNADSLAQVACVTNKRRQSPHFSHNQPRVVCCLQ